MKFKHLQNCFDNNVCSYGADTGHIIAACSRDWVVPEKIHTPLTDGILEILAGGGLKGSGNPGGRGG